MRSTQKFPRSEVARILKDAIPDVKKEHIRLVCVELNKAWAGERRDGDRRRVGKESLRHGRDGVMDKAKGRREQVRRDNPEYVAPELDDPADLAVI